MHYDAFGASSKVVFGVSVEVVLLAVSIIAKAMPLLNCMYKSNFTTSTLIGEKEEEKLEDVPAIFGKFNYFCNLISFDLGFVGRFSSRPRIFFFLVCKQSLASKAI